MSEFISIFMEPTKSKMATKMAVTISFWLTHLRSQSSSSWFSIIFAGYTVSSCSVQLKGRPYVDNSSKSVNNYIHVRPSLLYILYKFGHTMKVYLRSLAWTYSLGKAWLLHVRRCMRYYKRIYSTNQCPRVKKEYIHICGCECLRYTEIAYRFPA